MTESQANKITQNKKLELISLVYLIFFVLAVLSPSIVTQDYFGVTQAHVEEALIFMFGVAGLVTFLGYQQIMDRRMKERDAAIMTSDRVMRELQESYRYIGSINRHIEVLKSFVNKTSLTLVQTDAYRKDLLQSLVANAAQCVRSHSALVRFLDVEKIRTEKEVAYTELRAMPFRIANKELKRVHEEKRSSAFCRTDDGHELLIVPSDLKEHDVRAFLLMRVSSSDVGDVEISLLKVFVNQAELVYHSLVNDAHGAVPSSEPLALVDAMTSVEVGEIS